MVETVRLREVGPRDGLQLVKTMLPTERKLEWCRRSVAAGIREIEVTSFVPPKLLAQFADAAEVASGALTIPGLEPSALVPNLKGAERAVATGLPLITYVLSASEEHNLANVRRTTEQSIEEFRRIVAMRNAQAPGTRLGAGIATAFGCTISGNVPEQRVIEIAARLVAMGAEEIVVADTVGYGNPGQAKRILSAVMREVGDVPVAAHFHDTRGLGLANVAAALDVGVRRFDASLGGLGGCPFAPGATGNVDLEDCAYLIESLGFETGVSIEALLELRDLVASWLPDERFQGAIARAGLPVNWV